MRGGLRRMAVRLGLALVGLGVLAAAVLAGYAWRASPQTEGELQVAGLPAAVRVVRDAHGIPTIDAATPQALHFALGFVHAQDRLWQLETHRRIGSGRLAEAFGEAAVPNDRFLRILGVRRLAAAQWAKLSPASRETLQAYTDGINAYLDQHLGARPPEFVLLGLPLERWQPEDSLAWATMMAWDLGGNWTTELLRMRLSLKLPVARIDELLPPYPGERPLPVADYAALFRGLGLSADLGRRAQAAAPLSGVEGAGSNNWVLAPARTTTGGPLLANDPHLKLSSPALWYFARLKAPGIDVAGATLPGLPGVVLGQNADIAWGFTNTAPDVQDLYLEQLDPADPTRYRTPDGWATFTTRQEVIRIKGGAEVTLTVRETRHGPVISDADLPATRGLTGPPAMPSHALAMRWTALADDIDPVGVSTAIQRADSVEAFIAAARGWVAPMQNMVVADRAGHIALVIPGRVPVRAKAHDLMGQVPAPGWLPQYDWQGFLPADALPVVRNPPAGWLATANQRTVPADYPHYLTSEWAAPWRQQRIEQVLAARERHTLDDLARLQADQRSLAVRPLLPWLQRAAAAQPAVQPLLAGFDGEMAADQPAPLIFWAFARQLALRVFGDELGTEAEERSWRDGLEAVMAREDAWWCDDKRTPAAETCATQADGALADALAELRARFGDDPARWRWGDAHVARSEHRPFTRVKPLARWFEQRVPVGGDTYTVNVGRVVLRADTTTGERYFTDHGPSLRGLYDLADRSRSKVMHSTGQSGLPWAAHWRDFSAPWAAVEYVPLWPVKPGGEVLLLQPPAP